MRILVLRLFVLLDYCSHSVIERIGNRYCLQRRGDDGNQNTDAEM